MPAPEDLAVTKEFFANYDFEPVVEEATAERPFQRRGPRASGAEGGMEGRSLMGASGGKGGFYYGNTDGHGYEAVEGRMHIHGWHATSLHLLGLDHEELTYRYAGRDFRLTDVHGSVAKEILA